MKYTEQQIKKATKKALFATFCDFDTELHKEIIFDLNILKNLTYILQNGIQNFHHYNSKGYFVYYFLREFHDDYEFVVRFGDFKDGKVDSLKFEQINQYVKWVNEEINNFKNGAALLLLKNE